MADKESKDIDEGGPSTEIPQRSESAAGMSDTTKTNAPGSEEANPILPSNPPEDVDLDTPEAHIKIGSVIIFKVSLY